MIKKHTLDHLRYWNYTPKKYITLILNQNLKTVLDILTNEFLYL
jgi:hypothetical protein